MGRVKKIRFLRRPSSLRSRWLTNSVTIFFALGLVCITAVTATVGVYYYSSMRSDMEARARQASQFFTSYIGQNYEDYYQSCVTYAKTFEMRNSIELQFISVDGILVASSYGDWAGTSPTTSEIRDAMESGTIETFTGTNPDTGERIMAVSCPMIYSNGEVVGVLRYVTSTRLVDLQIFQVAMIALGAFAVLLSVLVLTSSYYIRSIVIPVEEVTEKAKRIANGSYGAQIQKKYNDEIGVLVDTINEMSAKINQNEKMQNDFISSLSHELRTPLTAITGWSETLLSGDDLDQDGVLELPDLIPMASLDDASGNEQYLIRWYSMNSDGSTVDKLHTYHSFTGGWYLELPKEIADFVSVTQFGNSYEFSVTDSDGVVSKLMTIYVFTGQEREEQAIADNRFVLYRTESTVYAGHLEVASAAYNMTQETLTNAFKLITQDLINGET